MGSCHKKLFLCNLTQKLKWVHILESNVLFVHSILKYESNSEYLHDCVGNIKKTRIESIFKRQKIKRIIVVFLGVP